MLELRDLKAMLSIALVFIPLERLLPLRAGQKVLRKHSLNERQADDRNFAGQLPFQQLAYPLQNSHR